VSAGSLVNSGALESETALAVTAAGVTNGSGATMLSSTRAAEIASSGSIDNQGTLQGATGLAVRAGANLSSSGKITGSGGTTTLSVGGTFTNTGETKTAGDLVLTAGGLDNRNILLSVGNMDLLGLGGLSNSDLILAGGTLTAQVSGAVSNNQGAIISGGDMAITGLGGGRAGSITNSLGVIQSDGGDVLLRAGSVHNQGDSDFEVKENVLIYEGTFGETPGVPARNSVPGAVITPEGYAYMKDGSTVVIDHPYPGLDWTVYYDTGNVTVKLYGTVATATGASTGKGEIVAGRNLTIDAGGAVLNDFSTLAAGGDLAISANSLVNKGIENVATLWFEWATNGQFNRCFGGPCVWFRNEGGTAYAGEIIGPGVGSIIQAGGGVNINVGTFDNTSEDPRDHDSWDM
ncbi:hypothetical protein, partial [Rhodospirillum sp. A1_3_36]|uniref:hypothetical protein n=1 Tax=Rhodospirillum sp. A1_3_36 TaxID=3391666 RepID=UPI0039A439AF